MPYYYFFLANFLIEDIPLLAPTWSLSVEEQYYLAWPLLLLLTLSFRHIRGWALLVGIVICVAVQQWGIWPGPIRTELAIWQLPGGAYAAILLGSLLAVVLNNEGGFQIAWRLLSGKWTPLFALAALIAALQFLPGILTGWPELLIHVTMVLFLASMVLREDHCLSRIMNFAPIARIGVISYGIYLYHLIGMDFTTRAIGYLDLDNAKAWISVLYIPVSILIAEISFRYFERYFHLLRHSKS